MTDQRILVTFDVNFPDDAEFSGSGDIVVPGGRSVCREIANLLAEQGLVVSEPAQHEFYGWEVTAEKRGRVFWFLLQYPGPWLLLAKERFRTAGLLDNSGIRLREVLDALANAMLGDARFRDLSWLTKAEYESGKTLGSPRP